MLSQNITQASMNFGLSLLLIGPWANIFEAPSQGNFALYTNIYPTPKRMGVPDTRQKRFPLHIEQCIVNFQKVFLHSASSIRLKIILYTFYYCFTLPQYLLLLCIKAEEGAEGGEDWQSCNRPLRTFKWTCSGSKINLQL